MANQRLVKINAYAGEEKNSKVFVLSMNVANMTIYDKAKATTKFINRETKVLEQALDGYLRQVIRHYGITIEDGSNQALEKAFILLENKGIRIDIIDRYYEYGNERIIGESDNKMTIIEEDGVLSCAIEIIVTDTQTGG